MLVETSLGIVSLSGAIERPGPIVVAITGAYANREALSRLAEMFPEAPVLVSHLPGNHSPWLEKNTIGALGAAYSQVLAALGRPAVVLGCSVGALVSMAISARELAALVLTDPPISNRALWPLRQQYLGRAKLAGPQEREFLWSAFGVGPEDWEDRDHASLLDALGAPTKVFIGGEHPFPANRPFKRLPSLVDDRDRKLLADCPAISLTTVQGAGHDIPGLGADALVDALRAGIRYAAQRQ